MANRFKIKALSLICLAVLLLPMAVSAEDLEIYTHKLTQSNTAYDFWTAPPSERVFKDDDVPLETGSEVKVYAAKNEFEPFQVAAKPKASGSVTVNIGDFGSGITAEIYQVKYVSITTATDSLGETGPYPDPLWPLEKNASVSLTANENTAFWFSVFVPETASSGDYTANVTVGTVSIPVKLHVFNFAIPDEIHVKSQMNFSHEAILDKYGVTDDYWTYLDKIKQYFIDHRLTPKGPVWPGGITTSGGGYNSTYAYDCNGGDLTETEPNPAYQFETLADKYLNGTGFNDGTGFPSFMAATFKNNDASADQRPSEFCGVSRGTGNWYAANSAYNQKWFQYITSFQNYLDDQGYLDKSYFYFANEPQDQADYDAAAWYSQELKKAAPDLKLMVSEEPKSEIYDHKTYTGAKIDIWLPVLNNYDPDISHDREKNHGEETWVYFLHGTRPPYFNPITLDHPGIESKFTGWLLWKYRIRGIAYYSLNDWSQNPWTNPINDGHNGDLFMLYPPSTSNSSISYGSNNHRFVPSIRFELMRDSLEDYEYLYLLNGSSQPVVDQNNAADTQADKIISSLTSYTRDSEFMYNLRRVIGLKNGGEISSIPDIQPDTGNQGTPGNYYINFQNPAGSPTANPLTVNGKTYTKIGWNTYSESLGYGWYGDMAHVMYQYLDHGPDELQKSIIYDDWGREKTFEYDLPNSTYNVTVSVGWDSYYSKTYSHHKIVVEGVSFINDEATTPSNPYIVRTKEVTVKDGKLTMEMGIFDEYTMLNYMDIEAVGGTVTPECTEADWQYTDGQCQSSNTLTRTWTKTGSCEGGASHPSTESIACEYDPSSGGSVLLADFGKTAAENEFGLSGWNTVIKDGYTDYRDIGPGGTTIVTGDNGGYDYQGVTGTAREFKAGESIEVTWYNNSGGSITFTPRISFNDPDRYGLGTAGTWHNMSAVTVSSKGTAQSTFTFSTSSDGTYSLVNVNVNHAGNQALICDKIELNTEDEITPPSGETVTLIDFGKTAAENEFAFSGWNTVIKDTYTDYRDIGPGGTTIVNGNNGGYDYQGVKGTAREFKTGESIAVTWYNDSGGSITFTPRISFEDSDRYDAAGNWHNMSTVTVSSKGTIQSIFTFNSASAGTYSLVNVNVNYSANQTLICDKIELIGDISTVSEPAAAFTADKTSGSAPLTVNFTDQSSNSPASWEWDFNNDGTADSTEQNPSHTYTSAGTYTVSLKVTNSGGTDTETKTDLIAVSSLPAAPVAAFSADKTSGSAPLTVTFTDQSSNSPASWEWDFNNDGTADSTKQNPSYTYSIAGTYTVSLKVTNSGGTDTKTKTGYIKVTLPENIIRITTADIGNIKSIVSSAPAGSTIVFADGTYSLNNDYAWLGKSDIKLRSESRDRDKVILDGEYKTGAILTVSASGITISDITLKRAKTHPIHVMATDSGNVENTLIYNVHIIDPGQQAIKINQNSAKTRFADYGVISGCHIEMTDTGRKKVVELNGRCYTGGIDAHQARGWIVQDNYIEGFWCETGSSDPAILFWSGSRDTLAERNVLKDNYRGIGFGLQSSGTWRTYTDKPCGGDSNVGHYDGIIRNNFIFQNRKELRTSENGFDTGIGLEQACGTKVLHNTVVSTSAPNLSSSAEWRFSNTNAEITNNLVSYELLSRDGGTAVLNGNLENAPLSLFVDGSGGDLHLSETADAAIDKGVVIDNNLCNGDIDGEGRDDTPDIGADEICIPTASADGDIDANCAVNLKDAVLALKIIAGKEPDSNLRLEGDPNGDGKISLSDAIDIIRRIVNNE